ncbi:MAG TPA: ABC transporter ATP-binding protein [Terriglobales bacterium]
MKPLLQIRGLSVTYPSRDRDTRPATYAVDLDVDAGERVGLLGPSGSGKSTIALATLGLLNDCAASSGEILLGGDNLLDMTETQLRHIRGEQVALIPQDPASALHPMIPVGRQIADVYRAHRPATKKRAMVEVAAMLQDLGLTDVPRICRSYPHQLSGGERQRAALAQALMCRPKLLIADEPTTALDPRTQSEIISLLEHFTRVHGMALLMISHDAALLERMTDRAYVLESGRIVRSGPTSQMLKSQTEEVAREARFDANALPLLSVQSLKKTFTKTRAFGAARAMSALQGVDLEVSAGTTTAIIGRSGSGKSTLARCIAGFESPNAGRLRFCGKDLLSQEVRRDRDWRSQIQLIVQESALALNPRFTAAECIAEPMTVRAQGSSAERDVMVKGLMGELGLPADLATRRSKDLSGGEKQRVAIARALAAKPRLLILDEALAGLDQDTQDQIVRYLQAVQKSYQLTYLFISHDLSFVREMADRVAVMQDGVITEEASTDLFFAYPQTDEARSLIAAELPRTGSCTAGVA